jgi:hypothetical protein
MPLRRALAALPLAALALLVLAWPSDALAWGPLAHLSFSSQALAQAAALQPAVRAVVTEFRDAFLYGSLAADIVVGKNMAPFLFHCHNWKVGFNVFRRARAGAEQAVALGFLSHLAADTVAHNYYVPFKTVGSFHKGRTGHAYWELRYDQRMDVALPRVARRVSTRTLRAHDRFLRGALTGASVLPFGLSRQLFGSLLASAGARRFQHLSRLALARERNLALEPDLVGETNDLAVRAILGVLLEGERSQAARADATGARNLRLALDLRGRLRDRTWRRRLPRRDAHEIALSTRESFRRAIHGKLVMPASIARLVA